MLFPVRLLDQLDREEMETLLVHELAHLARRDHWVRWLEVLASGLAASTGVGPGVVWELPLFLATAAQYVPTGSTQRSTVYATRARTASAAINHTEASRARRMPKS